MIETICGIDGMMCGMCEAHINDTIRKNFDVRSVKSNRKRKQCVIVSEAELDEERLRAVIAETGYEPLEIHAAPYQKKGLLGLF